MPHLLKDLNAIRPLFSKQDKLRYLLLLGLMLSASLIEALGVGAIPLFVEVLVKPAALSGNRLGKYILPQLPGESSLQVLLWASLSLILFIILKNIFLTYVFYAQNKVVIGQSIQLRDYMFRLYQGAPYEWHLQHSSAELLRSIQEDTGMILSRFVMPLLDLTMSFTTSALVVMVMVLSIPGTAIVGFFITALGLFVVVRAFQNQLLKSGLQIRQEGKGMIQAIQQGFGALAEARVFGCERYLSNVYKESATRHGKALKQQQTIQKATPYFIETVATAGLLVVILLLFNLEGSLETSLPIISLLTIATIRLKQMSVKMAAAINHMHSARASVSHILQDMQEFCNTQSQPMPELPPLGDFKCLELRNVVYQYPNADKLAISNISLTLRQGESIAFVGATGSGKSTLMSLVLGLLAPQQGRILVNGVDIFNNLSSWRRSVGYIPQFIFLTDDTIQANIAFGISAEDVDEKRLWHALRSARLEEVIQALPQGVNTVIGERGVRLSGGQRQRLGIARAIYFNPAVLVMDEATSSLDNKTELEVMEAIKDLKRGRTLITIAHRLSTVESYDRLYYLKDGQLEQSGSFEQLKQTSSNFLAMALPG